MDPLWVLVILVGLLGLAMMAWALRALDLPGAIASFALGAIVAFLGGVGWLVVMVAFTAVGFLATRFGHARKKQRRVQESRDGERGIRNVLANGSAAALAAFAVPMLGPDAAALAFATAVAAVTADTMASEVGSLADSVRRIIPPFEDARPGDNGAISWRGQVAAAGGAILIAVLAVFLVDVPGPLAWVPALGGFLGCQLDSLLGATLEGDLHRDGPLSKEDVNFIASAVPAFVVLLIA